ncbi:Ferlin [Gracilaria domingensis]|nr:Ferlin [Gracilaria domingensis]
MWTARSKTDVYGHPGNNVLDANENCVPGSILMFASLSRYDPTKNETQGVENHSVEAPLQADSVSQPEKKENLEDEIRPVDVKNVILSPRVAPIGEEMYRMVTVPKTYIYSMTLWPQRSYILRALIIQGRNLPAADDDGLSDLRFVVVMGDKRCPGSVLCRRTMSPLWKEAVEVTDVNMREGQRKPNVNVLIYDDDDGEIMEYLGRPIIPCAELDTAEPSLQFAKWYPVFSVNSGVIVGEILADFQLVLTELAIEHSMPQPSSPARSDSVLRISLVGLHDIKFLRYAVGKLWVECAISAISLSPEQSKRGAILQ